MTIVFELAAGDQIEEAADAVAAALRAGHLAVLPTETVYGIAALASDPAATARLFAAKRRPAGLALPVMAATPPAALELAEADDRAAALAHAFWPGPLTIVLPRSGLSRPWTLGDQSDTIGLRVPDHAISQAILRRTPPLAVTSANISGSPPAATLDELQGAFGNAVAVFVVQTEPLRQQDSLPSTVVDLAAGEPRIARAGRVSEEAIADAIRHALGQGSG
jgi:tRNA threonylcarbamoyl adenosine modification protein (Sua5/YciO/YrdC/YwlC family)